MRKSRFLRSQSVQHNPLPPTWLLVSLSFLLLQTQIKVIDTSQKHVTSVAIKVTETISCLKSFVRFVTNESITFCICIKFLDCVIYYIVGASTISSRSFLVIWKIEPLSMMLLWAKHSSGRWKLQRALLSSLSFVS